MPIEIDLRLEPAAAERLRDALLHSPGKLLKRLGVFMVAQGKRAFAEQRFGSAVWPKRYPNQPDGESFNVAGAIKDLQSAPRVKDRRYDPRPAGRDEGDLMRRLTYEVSGTALQVGSDVPYAQRFHAGGSSVQDINSTVRRNLTIWLRTVRRGAKRAARRDGTLGPRGGAPRTIEERLMGPLFSQSTHTTKSPARPFVGITSDVESELITEIKRLAGLDGHTEPPTPNP